MGNDITSQRAAAIASAKVFETSDNLRCGKYKLLLKRIIDGQITTRDGDRPGTIFELTPITAEPLPQAEGNMLSKDGKIVPWGTEGAKLMDDGMSPNAPGSTVALKIFYDGAGARSAPGNARQVVLGLFNKHEGEVLFEDIFKTYCEFFTLKPYKKGEVFATLPPEQGSKPLYADRDLPQNAVANDKTVVSSALCGYVIDCVVTSRKKAKTNDKGSHISKPVFSNSSVPGTGDNTPELIAKRREEIEAAMDDEEAVAPPTTNATGAQGQQTAAPNGQAQPPAAPTPPATPPTPPAAAWTPPAPWIKPQGDPRYVPNENPALDWWWDQGKLGNLVKSRADIQAGK